MIAEFGLDEQRVYDRTGVRMAVQDAKIEPSLEETWDTVSQTRHLAEGRYITRQVAQSLAVRPC
jgi:hypothetical protein